MRTLALAVLLFPIYAQDQASDYWLEPGTTKILAAESSYSNPTARPGLVLARGSFETAGHAFFAPLGVNARACVTCHQPSNAMSLSADTIRERWKATSGRQFVACPIVRDTKTQPCWLAEYEGETYSLGLQGSSSSDFYPPQLGHEVLVEGTLQAGPRVCGGIPLMPVKISVLLELNPACNTMLPAEDGVDAPPAAPRGAVPGPTF